MASIREQLQPKQEQQQSQQPVQPPQSKYRLSFGASPASRERTQQTIQTLFPGKTPEEVAHAVGAPEGSHILFSDHGGGNLDVFPTHPNLSGHFVLHKGEDGKLRMHIGRYDAKGPKGQMHQRFNDMVNHATNLGVHEITTIGSSDPHPITGKPDNGGYTWPRLGFNGQLPDELFKKLSPELQSKITAAGPKDYHTLFKVGGGSELQKTPHSTFSLHFDLNPNSPHRAAFNDYFRNKEHQRITGSAPATGGATQPATQHNAGNTATPNPNATTGTQGSPNTGAATSGVPATPPQSSSAARRSASLDRIRSLGQFKRQDVVVKYAAEPRHPRDFVSGTPMQHVLHNIRYSEGYSPTAKHLADQALQPVPFGVHPVKYLHPIFTSLSRQLRADGNNYDANKINWHRAAQGVMVDHAIKKAIDQIVNEDPAIPSLVEHTSGDGPSRLKLPHTAAKSHDELRDRALDHLAFIHENTKDNHVVQPYSPLTVPQGDSPRVALMKDLQQPKQLSIFTKGIRPSVLKAYKTLLGKGHNFDGLTDAINRVGAVHIMNMKDPSGQLTRESVTRPDDRPHLDSDLKAAFRYSRSRAAINFESAIIRLRSRLGDTLVDIAKKIHDKLNLKPHKVRKAVYDDNDSSIASTLQSVHHNDPDHVTAAAAHYGLLTETPSMAIFRTGEGPDSVHHFQVQGSGEKLRNQLNHLGLNQRVLVPTKNGYSVFVLDVNSEQTPLIKQAANSLGAHVTTVKGMHEIIGEGKDVTADKKARRGYRNVIQDASGGANPNA